MFFDIGANIGAWSLANLADKAATRIIAVEASPTTFQLLQKNLQSHSQMIVLNFAVCDNNNEPVKFYNANTNTISTLNKEWLDSEKSRFYHYTPFQEIMCESITLDRLIEQYGEPDLIKIDVEGGEYKVVKSLSKKVKCLCFEWAAEMNEVSTKCLVHLEALGFTEFYVQKEDNYTFRPPEENGYNDLNTVLCKLKAMRNKIDWGMIWAR